MLPPLDELEELRLLGELRLLDDLDRVERERDVPDPDRLPLARLDDPLLLVRRLPDFVVRRLPDFAVEPVRFFVPEERPRLELLERVVRPPCCEPAALPPLSSWSSSLPISFLATPTAAGTATPIAAPATTFLPVDIPSLPFSFSSISTFLS